MLLVSRTASPVTHQDTEEDHACQQHQCCCTLHHASTSQHLDFIAAHVAQDLSGQYCCNAAQPFLLTTFSMNKNTAKRQLHKWFYRPYLPHRDKNK